jgi:hypothetical protein
VHQLLFALLTIRLLLPPGICVCQWHSPAARMLVQLFGGGKEVPPSPPLENEDDHEPGCPASKLAAGMGLRPASPAPLMLGAVYDEVPPAPAAVSPVAGILARATGAPDPSGTLLADYALLI